MVQINMTRDEKEAVNEIDRSQLQKLVDKCIYEERTGGIHSLGLSRCGLYVASALRNFERALGDYSKAKSSKKREDTRTGVLRAGSDLVHAVQTMKDRAATELQDGQFFYVEDQILPPVSLREQLTVRVSYKWRRSVDESWAHSSITFSHTVVFRPDYSQSAPTRKPSAAKVRQEREARLYREWEHLRNLALCSVRDFFKSGGDGGSIPTAYSVQSDAHSGGLNNYSAEFWRERATAKAD
ncbi:hypothetical protein [Pseudomonas aeruginosa]|uniref:hypothetical protein n=1 Tax=Pseudomonas aeruginosa TaxID=287 RepID=UPI000BB8BF34|nr:hypothetical protein [Pseudomonas aeruginosa]MBH4518279.1 hypothetical protein [Pseudomonas aeruginosa]MBI7277794.1 hypothetical protein [Pseudomonas aeruginosa]MBX6661984.1 hypothetical protein [Pseudomonas aeruginosa]MCB5967558.1 hypothetical protein [Pseudomonas aeruginosa]MDI2552017.1 hypothetical protein [Pseudomonas aeruginosa]